MKEKKCNGSSSVSKCICLDPQISVVEMATDCNIVETPSWPSFLVLLVTFSAMLLNFSVRRGGQKF